MHKTGCQGRTRVQIQSRPEKPRRAVAAINLQSRCGKPLTPTRASTATSDFEIPLQETSYHYSLPDLTLQGIQILQCAPVSLAHSCGVSNFESPSRKANPPSIASSHRRHRNGLGARKVNPTCRQLASAPCRSLKPTMRNRRGSHRCCSASGTCGNLPISTSSSCCLGQRSRWMTI